MNRFDRQLLQIALPSIVSNITVPLLGMIDLAIVGHLGDAAYIGAIAVGGLMFNIMYWLFGFLRMGTGGMTSQAFGSRNLDETKRLLIRSLAIAWSVAACFIAFQIPIRHLVFGLIKPSSDVAALAQIYFHICIWGAPAVLSMYSFVGWFLGMQNSRFPMFIAIAQNVVNILASLLLVLGCHMKVEGVALGTLIAQYVGLFMAVAFYLLYYTRIWKRVVEKRSIWDTSALKRFFQVNRDIFFRTLCLVAVTLFFTSAGARQSDIILAVNALLMQLFTLFSYFMDGFAYAGEAVCGRYIGARNLLSLQTTVKRLFLWGGALAILFTLLYACGGTTFLSLLTDNAEVLHASQPYMRWTILIPFMGFAAFLWDGVFIGATATRYMLLSMLIASAAFFSIYFLLQPYWQNHALWCAFLCYLLLRGLVLWGFSQRLYNLIKE